MSIQIYNGGILTSGGAIAVHADCCCDETPPDDPCTDCADATNMPDLAGFTGACAMLNGTATFQQFDELVIREASVCQWTYSVTGGAIALRYFETAATSAYCGVTEGAGDWTIEVQVLTGGVPRKYEVTETIFCDAGAIVGSHVFDSPWCVAASTIGCNDSDTISVSF